MKNKLTKRVIMLGMVVVMAMFLAACSNSDDGSETETPVDTEEQLETEEQAEDGVTNDDTPEEVVALTTDELLESVADEDSYLILDGVGAGWAPTVMVLLNDGTFYSLVNYAGEATVKFVSGDYVESDGTITAIGTQYNTGEEIEYEITSSDGVYTTTFNIPDADVEVELTGTVE